MSGVSIKSNKTEKEKGKSEGWTYSHAPTEMSEWKTYDDSNVSGAYKKKDTIVTSLAFDH